MPEITRTTEYRRIGRVPFEVWSDRILKRGGRAQLASRGAWDAAGDLSAVELALLFQESKYDTDYESNSLENNDPFNVRVPSRENEDSPEGYVRYPDLVAACAAVRGRIDGEAGYFPNKPNPYIAARSIEQLLYTYAPADVPGGHSNETERLIDEMVGNLRAYLPRWAGPTEIVDPVVGELVFGRGVEPPSKYRKLTKYEDAGISSSAYEPYVGIVSHETQLDWQGAATDGEEELEQWFDFFNCPGGDRCDDAATHHVVARNGLAYTLIDPRSDIEPWVNGGSPANMVHPIGGLWNRTFGSGKRNRILRGIENVKSKGAAMSQAQIAWNAQMLAAILDAKQVPWTEMPRYKGVQQSLQHNWLSPTDCSITGSDQSVLIVLVQQFGKKWQLGSSPDVPPVPAPEPGQPPQPRLIFPGLDVELAGRWFGKVTQNGRTYQLTWPLGPAANLWVEHGKQTGSFAPLTSVEPYLDGRMYLRFADGLTLWRPSADAALRTLKG